MTVKKLVLFCLLFVCQFALAQKETSALKDVVLSDVYLKTNNKTQSVQVLNDSIISKNQSYLSDLLNYNSNIYFKQYGRGQLSTVSFRGTTASQTAVVWNGININSQLTGETDFNTITSNDYNSISVKAGGGSVLYGSGAIGGTVHLNNDLVFKKQIKNVFRADYGSFDSFGTNYKMNLSNEKWSTQIGFSYNGSENNYPYIGLYNWKGEQRKNINGQYYTSSLNANFGYKINSRNIIKFYSQSSITDRNLVVFSEAETKTKYINSFNRNLLEYARDFDRFSANFKTAYVFEEYQYFGNIDSDYFTFGKSECLITKLDLGYKPNDIFKVNTILDYNHTRGYGTSFGNNLRQIGSGSIIAKFNPTEHWQSEFGIRKEITNNYQSPLLFSLGTTYEFSKFYSIKGNISRNFRIPTFNDLYWATGIDHGNPNLKPESSYQAEVGNVFSYKKITLSQTFYYMKIKNLISWVSNNGLTPENTDRVQAYGAETLLSWANYFGKHFWAINGTYAYTISENEDTNKQLRYVPFHKITGSLAYSVAKFSANYQLLINGFVYTQADNDPKHTLEDFTVSNIGIDYAFYKSSKLGFQVLNLFNEMYQMQQDRPMPGRNFNLYLTIKF